jgi:hypothetical protein
MPASINLMIWVMVELTRDRRNPTLARDSVRNASKRVAQHLDESFRGGRLGKDSDIREYYKNFERAVRVANSSEQADMARELLDAGRRMRDLRGWETSTWALVMDPQHLSALGYTVLVHTK